MRPDTGLKLPAVVQCEVQSVEISRLNDVTKHVQSIHLFGCPGGYQVLPPYIYEKNATSARVEARYGEVVEIKVAPDDYLRSKPGYHVSVWH